MQQFCNWSGAVGYITIGINANVTFKLQVMRNKTLQFRACQFIDIKTKFNINLYLYIHVLTNSIYFFASNFEDKFYASNGSPNFKLLCWSQIYLILNELNLYVLLKVHVN